MLNFYTVVGRITEIKEKSIIIAVPRSYKNTDGIYGNKRTPTNRRKRKNHNNSWKNDIFK